MNNDELEKNIYEDSKVLSMYELDHDLVFNKVLPLMDIDVKLLKRFYSDENSFTKKEYDLILESLHKLDSGRFGEFVSYLLSMRHEFVSSNKEMLKRVDDIKNKPLVSIRDDSVFLSNFRHGDFHSIFTSMLPNMQVDVDLLRRFYSGEFVFNNEDARHILESLHRMISGRLREFIFYLISVDYDFEELNHHILKIVEEEKVKYLKERWQNMFYKSINYGYLDLATYLIKVNNIDIHADGEHAFAIAVNNGDLSTVRYLISLESRHRQINIHVGDEYVFRKAVEKRYLPIVKYLISLKSSHGKINIHAINEWAFRSAIDNYDLNTAKYLISLESEYGPINIHVGDEMIFRNAIRNNSLSTVEYLFSLEPTHGLINIHVDDEYAYRTALENKNLGIVNYLIGLRDTHGPINV